MVTYCIHTLIERDVCVCACSHVYAHAVRHQDVQHAMKNIKTTLNSLQNCKNGTEQYAYAAFSLLRFCCFYKRYGRSAIGPLVYELRSREWAVVFAGLVSSNTFERSKLLTCAALAVRSNNILVSHKTCRADFPTGPPEVIVRMRWTGLFIRPKG